MHVLLCTALSHKLLTKNIFNALTRVPALFPIEYLMMQYLESSVGFTETSKINRLNIESVNHNRSDTFIVGLK